MLRILPPEKAKEKAQQRVKEWEKREEIKKRRIKAGKQPPLAEEPKGKRKPRKKLAAKEQERVNEQLFSAAHFGTLSEVREALDNGAQVNAQNWERWTALMWAAENENKEMVELLISKGADVNARNKYGGTALKWAAAKGNLEIAKLLIAEGADVSAEDNNGWTVLRNAEASGNGELVILLKKHGAIR